MNRDLDAAIAEQILGWSLASVGKDYYGENECEVLAPGGVVPEGFELPRIGSLHRGYLTPCYSSDLGLAMQLAKRVLPEAQCGSLPVSAEAISRLCLDQWRQRHAVVLEATS